MHISSICRESFTLLHYFRLYLLPFHVSRSTLNTLLIRTLCLDYMAHKYSGLILLIPWEMFFSADG